MNKLTKRDMVFLHGGTDAITPPTQEELDALNAYMRIKGATEPKP